LNFTVDKPLTGHDEDAPAYADDRFLIVCDGLGGGGQNTYQIDGVKRTSAYLGSRRISLACQEYFSAHYEEFCAHMQDPATLIAGLKSHISQALDYYVSENNLQNRVKGKSMQMLPSTLTAIIYKHFEDHTDALVISAGDSRAFVLTPDNGLQQISKDDVFADVDAFEKSATMTNNIRQDGDFHINYGYHQLPARCILFVCSDGCFDYLSTPMELEFRLEYSITKCGELFDPERDNLGQFLGIVLEKSGLQDDCTMAGVILGYTDGEETQKLFLKRAYYLQEKYRTPCATCDKESPKRRSEVKPQLDELEDKLSRLREEIETGLHSALLAAFQYELDGNADTAPTGIRELIPALRGLESYQALFRELQAADEETVAREATKQAQYREEMTQLQQSFKALRFEEMLTNLVRASSINIFNPEKMRLANEYRQLTTAAEAAERAYAEALSSFSAAFEELKKRGPRQLSSMDEFAPIHDRYLVLQNAMMDHIAYKQKLQQCREHLRAYYMESDESVEQAFISVWKSKFAAYAGRAQYTELYGCYERCIGLQKEIEACTPPTREEKLQKCKAYLDANLPSLTELIKNDPALCELICGTAFMQLTAMETQLEALKKHASEFDDKKYALWLEYKPNYERFTNGLGGVV